MQGQRIFQPENLPQNLVVVARLRTVATRHGITIAQLALAWVLANPVVSVGLVGALRRREVEENAGAELVRLGTDKLEEIDGILEEVAGRTTEIPHWWSG